eukprot:8170960-Ditylum_brightwellii.AAC.1
MFNRVVEIADAGEDAFDVFFVEHSDGLKDGVLVLLLCVIGLFSDKNKGTFISKHGESPDNFGLENQRMREGRRELHS